MSELGGRGTRAHSVASTRLRLVVSSQYRAVQCSMAVPPRSMPTRLDALAVPQLFPPVLLQSKGVSPAVAPARGNRTRDAAVFAAWQKAAQSPGQLERQGSARAPRFEAVFRVVCLNSNSVFYCPDCHSHACRLRKRPCRAATPANQRRRVACQEGSPTQAIPSRDAEPVF